MTVLGVAVRARDKRPALYVAARGDGGDLRTWTYIASKGDDLADQVHDLGRAFETYLAGLQTPVRAVIVREADDVKGGLTDARKKRLRCEGVVLDLSRQRCNTVQIKNGRQVASACAEPLKELDARLSDSAGKEMTHALTAALAAERIANS